jgi:NADH dehydrogenase
MATSIFLTGGTGFLGGYLAPELATWAKSKGRKLRALVRPPLERPAAQALERLGIELLVGDLQEIHKLASALEGVELIIHLAGILEGSRRLLLEANWQGTVRLLAAAQTAGVEKIIHLSSIGAVENPKFPYAYSIWLAEQAVLKSGLQFVIFRPSILIGPSDPFTGGLIRMVLNWPVVLLPKSRTKFQPLWIGDMVRCILGMLEAEELPNEIIELGGPEVVTLDELFHLLQAELGLSRPVVHLPRRPLRALVRILRRLGLDTPLVSSHLIGADNVARPRAVEAACGFVPRSLKAVLNLQEEAEVSILWQRGEE